MKVAAFSLVTLLFVYQSGCMLSDQSILKEFNGLKTEVKQNYNQHKTVFNQLQLCLACKYIKVIEFEENNIVHIQYNLNDTAAWQKTHINIADSGTHTPLKEEGLSMSDLLDLKESLRKINGNSVWIIDLYDRFKGTERKGLEVKYLTEVNDLHFYYKIFDKPLDSIPEEFYSQQTAQNIGGILDKNIIYYYK